MKLQQTIARAVACLLLAAPAATRAADHLDAPMVRGDGQTDINDLYAFQSPANSANTVLIMTVNPFAGVMNPFGGTSPTDFSSEAEYTFNIDNTGDSVADLTFTATFGAASGGVQSVNVTRNGDALASGSSGQALSLAGGGAVSTGVFDDPFFFDFFGFLDGLQFTGEDSFAGANVSAIVLEAPSSTLGGPEIGIWATTSDADGNQIDRMGRPAINTVLIPSDRKDEFNLGDPTTDLDEFGDDLNASIVGLSDQQNADALTPVLLPDVLTFNTSDARGYDEALNGRRLEDDVIDTSLTLLTGSPTPIGDGVNANDAAFLNVFPYLAPANPIVPEPSGAALSAIAACWLAHRRRRRQA